VAEAEAETIELIVEIRGRLSLAIVVSALAIVSNWYASIAIAEKRAYAKK
jgi:hypothetical protein